MARTKQTARKGPRGELALQLGQPRPPAGGDMIDQLAKNDPTLIRVSFHGLQEADLARLEGALRTNTVVKYFELYTEQGLASSEEGLLRLAQIVLQSSPSLANSTVNMENHVLSSDGLVRFAQMVQQSSSSLKKLVIRDTDLPLGFFPSLLPPTSGLQELELYDCHRSHTLFDEGVILEFAHALKTNSGLARLHVRIDILDNPSAGAFVEAMAASNALVHLDLRSPHTALSATGTDALGILLVGNHTLQKLEICFCCLDIQVLTPLARSLETNGTLQFLDLKSNGIDEDGVRAIATMLANNTSLLHLMLGHHNIRTNKGAAAIAAALETNSTLQQLDLSNNETGIGVEGARAIAKMLRNNASLLHLNLHETHVQSEGVAAIANALETNSTLQNLNFANRPQNRGIDEEGASAIGNMLRHNTGLRHLYLGSNNIGSEEEGRVAPVASVAAGLAANESLVSLDLSGNGIGDDGMSALMASLEINSTLESLDLTMNDDITGDGLVTALGRSLPAMRGLKTLIHDVHLYNCPVEKLKHIAEILKSNTVLETFTTLRGRSAEDNTEQHFYVAQIWHYTGTLHRRIIADRDHAHTDNNNSVARLSSGLWPFILERFHKSSSFPFDNLFQYLVEDPGCLVGGSGRHTGHLAVSEESEGENKRKYGA